MKALVNVIIIGRMKNIPMASCRWTADSRGSSLNTTLTFCAATPTSSRPPLSVSASGAQKPSLDGTRRGGGSARGPNLYPGGPRREPARSRDEEALTEGRAADERWHVKRDGTLFWASGQLTPLYDGSLHGFLKILRDHTEQRRAAEHLRASEERFRTLAEGIPQLVWRSRSNGERTWGSPQWSAYSGLSEDDSLGLGWLDAVHPADREATSAAWAEAERSGSFSADYRVCRAADGIYGHFKVEVSRYTTRRGASSNGWEPRPILTTRCAPVNCWPAERRTREVGSCQDQRSGSGPGIFSCRGGGAWPGGGGFTSEPEDGGGWSADWWYRA